MTVLKDPFFLKDVRKAQKAAEKSRHVGDLASLELKFSAHDLLDELGSSIDRRKEEKAQER